MSEMSPLATVLMYILRNGSIAAACLLVLFIGIDLYQRLAPDGHLNMTRQDWGFIGVLVVMLLAAVYLARAIGKEIKAQRK